MVNCCLHPVVIVDVYAWPWAVHWLQVPEMHVLYCRYGACFLLNKAKVKKLCMCMI